MLAAKVLWGARFEMPLVDQEIVLGHLPPLGKNLEDAVYMQVLEEWINSL